jgi:hypothetical protein
LKKLVSFDFDKTICFTPEPNEGKVIFKNITGLDWPYSGWWGRKESLDLNIFKIPVNPYVFKEYLKFKSDKNSYVILATGRLSKMKNEVENILTYNNLSFDEIYCNPGMDTYTFKINLFESLIRKHKPEEFIMFDDRQEHLVKFSQWAKTQTCQIHIIDVLNETKKSYNKTP